MKFLTNVLQHPDSYRDAETEEHANTGKHKKAVYGNTGYFLAVLDALILKGRLNSYLNQAKFKEPLENQVALMYNLLRCDRN